MIQNLIKDVAANAARNIIKTLPLPISLPAILERAKGPRAADELKNRTVFMSRFQSLYDQAIAAELMGQGAQVIILDPKADNELVDSLNRPESSGGRIHRAPTDRDDPKSYTRALKALLPKRDDSKASSRLVFIHTIDVNASEERSDILKVLEDYYTTGHAAANILPAKSRLLFLIPPSQDSQEELPKMAKAALGGFFRSMTKELGKKGVTVHCVEGWASVDPAHSALITAYLAGPRASFLTALWIQANRNPTVIPQVNNGLLKGKVAIITGAARGIGASIAMAFAQEGATIGINDLPSSEKAAAKTLAALRKLGVRTAFLPFDVSTKDGAQAMAKAIEAEFGHVDIIINNAGITRDRTIKRMTPENWKLAVNVNLGAGIHVTDGLIPLMRKNGSILNLSSVMGIAGNFGQTNYSAAKAGVIGLTEVLSDTLKDREITVNALAPGFIETRMTKAMPFINREMAKQLTALLQPGLPKDVADVATFLVSPLGASISGQTIRVDGGMAIGK
jgi:3-oxoacyl-[acyl-carrier protein] reductase